MVGDASTPSKTRDRLMERAAFRDRRSHHPPFGLRRQPTNTQAYRGGVRLDQIRRRAARPTAAICPEDLDKRLAEPRACKPPQINGHRAAKESHCSLDFTSR